MDWITPTEAGILTKLSAPELTALKTAAVAPGQDNPLVESIKFVVNEISGYVAACDRNTLGPVGTIPPELELAALNRIRYELATRLPVASLLTEGRVESNRNALSLFKEVAACRFRILPPTDAAPEQVATNSAVQVATSTRRVADRHSLRGL